LNFKKPTSKTTRIMKFKLCFFALLAIMAASCERNIDIPEPAEQEGGVVIIEASIPPETRVLYTDSNTPDEGGTLSWQTGDTLLLAGYDGTTYIGSSKFGYTGTGKKFSGMVVPGASTYKAYYPGDVITLDGDGEVQLPADFRQQTQNGDNSTAHLSKKLLMSDMDAKALDQSFTLTSKSSIVRLNINNIPPEVGTLQKVIWTLQTSSEGFTELAILNVTGVNSGTTSLTAFLAFDPAVMKIAENGEVKVTLIGSQSSYEWSTNTTKVGGMTYEAGKRYYATVNGDWTTLAKPRFRFTIQTTEDNQLYEIWQKESSSTSPAKLTINWGEVGKPDTTIPKDASLAKSIADHTYDSPGTYTITITTDEVDPTVKQMPQIIFYNQDGPAGDGQLTAILDPFPNMGATDFFSCFAGCIKLNSVPEELFKYNTSATDFRNCFFLCTGLTDAIPTELFKYNTQAMYFTACFEDCTGLTGAIPENLFRYNTQAHNFSKCFSGCTQLSGTIPADLFRYNTQAMYFKTCFQGCTGLTDAIPAELFRYNTKAQSFYECFADCTQLSGTIPADLFRYNTQATDFGACFSGWQQLTEIPADLFRYNTQAQGFMGCFLNCSQLNDIPADLFRYNTQAKYFNLCFEVCTGLSSIPADLFKYNTQATSFHSCFRGCTGLSTIPLDLFRYNTQATDFYFCFSGCTGLSTIPLDLFRYNTQATLFNYCFHGCTGLSSLPENLFSYNTQALNFYRCFFGCTKLQLRADIFPDPSTNPGFFEGRKMNFKECFKDVGSDPAATAGTAPELWRFTGGGGTTGPTTWTITSCFYNANVTNYNSIPNHWKGL